MSPGTNESAPTDVGDDGLPASGGTTGAPAGPTPGAGEATGTGTGTETGTEADAGTEASTGVGTETDTGTEASSGAGTEADTGTNADAGTDAGTGTEASTGAGAEAGAGTDADAGTETGTATDACTATGVGAGAGTGTGTDAGDGDSHAADTGTAAGDTAPADGDGGVRAVPAGVPSGAAGVADGRVVAVRRVAAAGRRWRAAQLTGCVVALAVALTAGGVVLGARDDRTAPVAAVPGTGVSPQLLASADLDAGIRSLQAHLRSQPRDFGSWATLGLAYVEQARTKGDPSRYPQAERALDRSLRLRPDNDPALAGHAALAAARHRFPEALKWADRALAENPYSERALSSRIDALVELGRYDEASEAADLADSRRPGVPVFTRYAYVHELRGDVKTARRVLEQALGTATSRGDVAYVATALGQLAWNQGEYGPALTYYDRALAADEAYLPALEGRARTQAATGENAKAIRGMEDVVSRSPLPQALTLLGELYEARGGKGDARRARDQYALVDAWTALARANGVNADLDTALAAADHGDRAAALTAARAEWSRRRTVHTADALAWALHVNGRDEEALPYARRATATGYRNAAFLQHRGTIERATGHPGQARSALSRALELNPGFSPSGARAARADLKALGEAR
ncbi:tetratricopeptide repeat protein [Streptomyces sp. NPDC005496]|uniref:tetratricopeptide repeat protein n=1 Tax=Streptomyces sp. NPDC005496 TaxID=3364716 RepID=UPI0036A688B3